MSPDVAFYFVMVRRDVLGGESLDQCAASVVEALSTNRAAIPWSDSYLSMALKLNCCLLSGQIFLLDDKDEIVKSLRSRLQAHANCKFPELSGFSYEQARAKKMKNKTSKVYPIGKRLGFCFQTSIKL